MGNETAIGSAGTPDRRGHSRGGAGEQSPLQARAQFLKNRSWELVISLNRGACQRGRAQHGINSEAAGSSAQDWETIRTEVLRLDETFDRLRSFHQKAPFLFFNGNTFATIARELSFALFSDLAAVRRREIGSAAAHYVAGVLDRESMVAIVEGLCESSNLKLGDRVKTLRGSSHGVVVGLAGDGRVLWRPDGTQSELSALPESLLVEKKGRKGNQGKRKLDS